MEPDSHLLDVHICKGSSYSFEDEDPGVYSDLEEPHRNYHYEAFPDQRKNFPDQQHRIGYQPFEFQLGGGSSRGSKGDQSVLKKIAGLVRQEQALL